MSPVSTIITVPETDRYALRNVYFRKRLYAARRRQ